MARVWIFALLSVLAGSVFSQNYPVSVAHAFNPAMYRKLPYDPEKAFAPIGIVAAGPVALTRRSAIFPDTPTVAETIPGYDATNWWGLVAPAGTPAPILARIFAELETIVKQAGITAE